MGNLSALAASELVRVYDFSAVQTVADVGGAHGVLLTAVLRANPAVRAEHARRPDSCGASVATPPFRRTGILPPQTPCTSFRREGRVGEPTVGRGWAPDGTSWCSLPAHLHPIRASELGPYGLAGGARWGCPFRSRTAPRGQTTHVSITKHFGLIRGV